MHGVDEREAFRQRRGASVRGSELVVVLLCVKVNSVLHEDPPLRSDTVRKQNKKFNNSWALNVIGASNSEYVRSSNVL